MCFWTRYLASLRERIALFQDEALENYGVWSDADRRERSGFLLLSLMTPDRDVEACAEVNH